MDVSIGSRTEQHSSTGLILGTVEISFFLSVSSRCLLQGESPSLSTLISSYQILSSERLFPLKSFHGYQGHQHLVTRQGTFREKEGRTPRSRAGSSSVAPGLSYLLSLRLHLLLSPGAGPPLPHGRSKSMRENCTVQEIHSWDEVYVF